MYDTPLSRVGRRRPIPDQSSGTRTTTARSHPHTKRASAPAGTGSPCIVPVQSVYHVSTGCLPPASNNLPAAPPSPPIGEQRVPVPPDSPIAETTPGCTLEARSDLRAAHDRAVEASWILTSLVEDVCTNPGNSADAGAPKIDAQSLPYPCRRWFWRNQTTDDIMLYRCRKWSCPDCSTVLADRWAKMIAFAPVQRHIVLTNLGHTNAEATARLQNIIKAARRGEALPLRPGQRRHPVPFEYFSTLEGGELGRRSASHFPQLRSTPRRPHPRNAGIHAHLLQHGRSLPQRQLSALAARHGAGAVTWIRAVDPADIADHVVSYVVDHLVGVEHPLQKKRGRRLRYSRHFWGDLSRIDVQDLLWPPSDSPGKWDLVRPDVLHRDVELAEYHLEKGDTFRRHRKSLEDRAEEQRILSIMRHGGSIEQLQRLGLAFPTGD